MSLPELANQMRSLLVEGDRGHVWIVLPRGLTIVMEHSKAKRKWRLAIGRIGVEPSQTEIDVVARAYNVPAGTEWKWQKRKDKRPKATHITYQLAECTWIEEAPPCPTP